MLGSGSPGAVLSKSIVGVQLEFSQLIPFVLAELAQLRRKQMQSDPTGKLKLQERELN
jgi:hypothetical protein